MSFQSQCWCTVRSPVRCLMWLLFCPSFFLWLFPEGITLHIFVNFTYSCGFCSSNFWLSTCKLQDTACFFQVLLAFKISSFKLPATLSGPDFGASIRFRSAQIYLKIYVFSALLHHWGGIMPMIASDRLQTCYYILCRSPQSLALRPC
jgi:hypothetical protein